VSRPHMPSSQWPGTEHMRSQLIVRLTSAGWAGEIAGRMPQREYSESVLS
jgi:hypothetical protein